MDILRIIKATDPAKRDAIAEALGSNDRLKIASDILLAQLIEATIDHHRAVEVSATRVVNSLNHIVPARPGTTLDNETGQALPGYVANHPTIGGDGKIKLVIEQTEPIDNTQRIMELTRTLTQLEAVRSKISPKDTKSEYLKQIVDSIKVVTEQEMEAKLRTAYG